MPDLATDEVRSVPREGGRWISVPGPRPGRRLLAAGFLGLILAGFTLGCWALDQDLLQEFDWPVFLFAIVLHAFWLFVLAWIWGFLFYTTGIWVGPDRIETRSSAGLPLGRETYPLDRVGKIVVEQTSGGGYRVELQGQGAPAVLLDHLAESTARALRRSILEALPMPPGGKRAAGKTELPRAPLATHWQLALPGDGTAEFQQPGRLLPGWLLLMLMLAVAWNAAIAAMAVGLWQQPNLSVGSAIVYGLALSPFALVGVLWIVLAAGMLLEPVRLSTVQVSGREVVRQHRYLGIPWSRRWSPQGPLRVRRRQANTGRAGSQDNAAVVEFADGRSAPFEWPNLTPEEADWIVASLVKVQPDWKADLTPSRSAQEFP